MRSSGNQRWVRVGYSSDQEARAAGVEAARGALGGPEPGLLIVFVSLSHDLPDMLAGVAEQAGDVPVIGCSTGGEIVAPHVPDGDAGVVVVGLGGPGFQIRTAHASGMRKRARQAGEEIGSALLPLPDTRHRAVVLLAETLVPDPQEMIRGVYGVLGAALPMVGGGAGYRRGHRVQVQLSGRQVLEDAVVAACIGSDSPLGIGIRHGWHRSGSAMVVTGSDGSQLLTLDDRPALDVYLELLGAPPGIAEEPQAFFEFAIMHPFAVAVSRRGDDAVRHVISADPLRRSLTCGGTLPRGAAAWLMAGDESSALAAADAACADAAAQLGGAPPLGLLVFDCLGRRTLLGEDGVVAERAVMSRRAGDAPVAGFYSCGEIARTRGVNGFHNQTVVALALS